MIRWSKKTAPTAALALLLGVIAQQGAMAAEVEAKGLLKAMSDYLASQRRFRSPTIQTWNSSPVTIRNCFWRVPARSN